jgi:hypothetical protein
MTKHTPGPWSVEYGHNYDEIIGPKQEGIAETGVWQTNEKAEQHANARLIAAGPELLDALTTLLIGCESAGHDSGISWAKEQARDAIAKATGIKRCS